MLRSGERCGKYRIIRKVGEGGEVYLARLGDAAHTGQFALKLTDHVEKEVEALDLLGKHPSLPRKYEVFRDEERRRWVLVLESVPGESLGGGRGRRLSAPQRLWVLQHLARVLAHVHESGRVHRDVKPENLMLDDAFYERPEDPRHVRLIDFDIVARARTPVTRYGDDAQGTPRYMAPEALWLASGAANDRAWDVFAFGVLGWELFTGRHPYGTPSPGEDSRGYYRALYARASSLTPQAFPRDELPGWGAGVHAVLRACLSLRADDRPEMDEVLDRLPPVPTEPGSGFERAGAVSGPVVSAPPRTAARRSRGARRAWLSWGLATNLVFIGSVVLAFVLSSWRSWVESERPAAPPPPQAGGEGPAGLVAIDWGPGSTACPTAEPLLVFGACEAFRDLAWLGDELRALRRKGVGSLADLSPSFTLRSAENEAGIKNYFLFLHDPGGRKRANIWIQKGKMLITDLTTKRRFWLGYGAAGQWYTGPDVEHMERVQ
jgi:serine/threonine protein kinase